MKSSKKTYNVPEGTQISLDQYEMLKKATLSEMLEDTRELLLEMFKAVGVELKDGKLPEDVNYKLNIDRVYSVELNSLKQLQVKLEVAKVQVKDANKIQTSVGQDEVNTAMKYLEEQEKKASDEN